MLWEFSCSRGQGLVLSNLVARTTRYRQTCLEIKSAYSSSRPALLSFCNSFSTTQVPRYLFCPIDSTPEFFRFIQTLENRTQPSMRCRIIDSSAARLPDPDHRQGCDTRLLTCTDTCLLSRDPASGPPSPHPTKLCTSTRPNNHPCLMRLLKNFRYPHVTVL